MQLEAIKQIPSIIRVVGLELSRGSILPTLEEKLAYEFDDEVSLNISIELPAIFKALDNNFIEIFVSYFNNLLIKDDFHVRETSIGTLKSIGHYLKDSEIENLIVPLVLNLAESDWFPGKCSASSLFDVSSSSL